MDPRRFDALTRSLAAPKTRRGLIGSVTALAAGLAGLRGAGAQVTQAHCGNVACANNPGVCKPGCVCCVYANGNSRCRPPGNCTGGAERCPADRPLIDPVRGCVQCLNASQCPAPTGPCEAATCTNGVCGVGPAPAGTECRAAADACDVAEVCDGSSPACPGDSVASSSVVCRSASCTDGVATLAENCSGTGAACPPLRTQSCAPYRCAGIACATGCADDTGCVDGYHCDDGRCLLDAGLGTPCDENSDCESGFCVDGVCCNTACDGLCDTCIGATPGICTTATCNAPGTCQVSPGTCNAQTGTCDYGRAQDGTSCGTGGQTCCAGTCCDPGKTCVEGSCQVACSDLGGACAGNGDCCGTAICDNGRCLPCRALAEVCSGEDFCCNDGVTLCEGGQCCHPLSESCAFNAECCSFRCQDGSCCQRPGGECSDDGECCYSLLGACRQGVCACQNAGDACDENGDCCDELSCQNGICRPVVCQNLQGQCVFDTDCCADTAFCRGGGFPNYCCAVTNGACTEREDCCGADSACISGRCQQCIAELEQCNPVAQDGCCDGLGCRFIDYAEGFGPKPPGYYCVPEFCHVNREWCSPTGQGMPCCDEGVCEGSGQFGSRLCCQPAGTTCQVFQQISAFGECCPPNVCDGTVCGPCREIGETCSGTGFASNCCFNSGRSNLCSGGVCVPCPVAGEPCVNGVCCGGPSGCGSDGICR